MNKNKGLPNKKEAVKPNQALVEFYETLQGRVMKHVKTCLQNKNYFEAYIFSWALVDQILIRDLISFIAKNLKIKIPSNLWNSNQATINNFYLAISQDEQLYKELEAGRKTRNKFLHELVKKFDKGPISIEAKKATGHVFEDIVRPIFDRLSGKTPVPSLTSYSRGWNDSLEKAVEILKQG